MSRSRETAAVVALGMLLPVGAAAQHRRATLTEAEEARLRETQEASQRIELYLDLLESRLLRFEEAGRQPVDPRYDQASFLRELLDDYILLNDELKTWIEDRYDRMVDMRGGLRELIERAPRQLMTLRAIQQQRGPHAAAYADSLQNAIDQMADTVDGATIALNEQTRKLGELKRQEKEEIRAAKRRAKEEAKKDKAARKERRRQDRKGTVPGDLPEE